MKWESITKVNLLTWWPFPYGINKHVFIKLITFKIGQLESGVMLTNLNIEEMNKSRAMTAKIQWQGL